MIKLKTFEIRAYRSCKKTKIIIHPEFTSLIGVNGSGKSNILNAILLLKRVFLSHYPRRNPPDIKSDLRNKTKIDIELDYYGNPVFVSGEILFETDERNNDEILDIKLKWNLNSVIEGLDSFEIPSQLYSYLANRTLPIEYIVEILNVRSKAESKKLNPKLLEKVFQHISKIIDYFSDITYYSASQFSDPSKCPNFIELEDDRPLRVRRSSSGHERFIMDLYLAWSKKDHRYENYLNLVNKSGIGLLDNISFSEVRMPSSSIEVLSGGTVKTIEKSRVIIVPTFSIDNNNLSPNQLSEGTLRALALIFYILNDESKLLLLEEPEVCVHHGLLNSLIALLKAQSKHKQIIISTHSDYILDQLSPDNLILISRKVNKGTIAQTLNKLMKKNDFKALKIYLSESGNLGEYWKAGGLELS